jgi:hypothetical protein
MRNGGFVENSLDEVLFKKMEKNKVRPMLHGNLF